MRLYFKRVFARQWRGMRLLFYLAFPSIVFGLFVYV